MYPGTLLWNIQNPFDFKNLQSEITQIRSLEKDLFKGKGRKSFLDSSHRTITPQQTLGALDRKKLLKAGITRVSDITGLDILGIPTYMAVRPAAYYSTPLETGRISIYNGKGFTKDQAKTSAIMEAFERCSAEPYPRNPLIASYKFLKKKIKTVDPYSLNFSQKPDPLWREAPIEWKVGLELNSRTPLAVQAVNIFSPYVGPSGTILVQPYYSTTGLASGNTLLEATVHALFEIIERHATTPHLKSVKIFKVIPDKVNDPKALTLLRKLQKYEFTIGIQYYQTDLNIPVFRASIDDPITRDPTLLCYGTGCHLSGEVALIRALTEAVQSRLTVIAGTREDIHLSEPAREDDSLYDNLRRGFCSELDQMKAIPYSEIPQKEHLTFREDLSWILKKLKKLGYPQVGVFNLTRPDLEVPVVRVVVPRLPIQDKPHHDLSLADKDVKNRKNTSQ